MRTSLFLSTLFAVSLLGGAALAEKPAPGAATPREPRSVERFRAHGDTVDKAYRGASAGARPSSDGTPATQAPARTHAPVDRSANRINCSDTGVDCRSVKGKTQSRGESGADASGRSSRPPAFLDKVLGSDRTNFNEAGEDQGMSVRAARRAWSGSAGANRGNEETAVSIGAQRQVDRKSQQASDARMSCNEADECSMGVKTMRKEWAKAAIDAGTWKGPAAEPVSNAQRRIAEQRAAEGATAPADKKAEAKDGRKDAHQAEHPH